MHDQDPSQHQLSSTHDVYTGLYWVLFLGMIVSIPQRVEGNGFISVMWKRAWKFVCSIPPSFPPPPRRAVTSRDRWTNPEALSGLNSSFPEVMQRSLPLLRMLQGVISGTATAENALNRPDVRVFVSAYVARSNEASSYDASGHGQYLVQRKMLPSGTDGAPRITQKMI